MIWNVLKNLTVGSYTAYRLCKYIITQWLRLRRAVNIARRLFLRQWLNILCAWPDVVLLSQELYYGKLKEAWLCWSKIQKFIRNQRYDKEGTWAVQAYGGVCKIKRTAGGSGGIHFSGTRSPVPDESNEIQEKRVNRIKSSKGEELTILYTNADSLHNKIHEL